MNYKDFVLDFAQRTFDNLVLIEKQSALKNLEDGKAYEVTALINSFIGLLVFPQQEFYSSVPKQFPTLSIKNAFKAINSDYPCDKRPSYREMLRHLRNAVSHQRLSVHPVHTEVKNIGAFKFEDFDPNFGYKFEIILSIEVIREILFEMLKFVHLERNLILSS